MKRLALAHAIPIVAVVLAASPYAQQPETGQTVFRTGTNMVALNVTVIDPKKQFVPGLTRGDFAVFEDGVQQQVSFFEAQDIPVDRILLIDTSSSMRDKMNVVHDAAIGFLKTMKPGDRGAVVSFNDTVDVVQSLTSEADALERAIKGTVAKGSTSLHNALYVALKEFARTASEDGSIRRQAIAVLSDGEDTSSLISFDDVLALARKSGVSIYTIGLHSRHVVARATGSQGSRYFSTADYSMRSLAQETGAQAFFPLEATELKGIYAAIAQELASQYSMAYSPANGRSDGRYRRIVVRVNSRPDLQLRTRSGYTAEAARTVGALLQRDQ